MTCELCELEPATVEAVLFPTRVESLFAMMHAHHEDTEQWPSVKLCEACAERTAPLFKCLCEIAPPHLLVDVTSAFLLEMCKVFHPRVTA